MIRKLGGLWRSVGFRLAFSYGFLVAVTMLAALAIVYLQTVGVLHQRIALTPLRKLWLAWKMQALGRF